ncbi:disease resistance protein RPV1-like isoform X2 [Syzygium oleosum]|uniref:disease resistance protein RPV1-like isoform X2 n=1 Tax=Syzygium oleosum TaxID=219896 RepID=UPI0024BA2B60|nr:disease resistance protein RPV1-like isoform X2 [Syzygium oleosum]
MAEYDVYNLEMGEDEPARLDQSKGERSKVEAVRLAEIARTRLIAAHDVQVKRKQVMMKSVAAESSYDVFLSFSGSENPFGFAHSLHRRLQAGGLLVFRDDAPLRTPKELPTRVYSSKIYVPIFTGTYGYSPWCLESLALMAEHASRSGGKEEVRPVFYNRGPSDVKLETPIYRDAVDMLRRTWGAEKVERWKKALVEAGKIKGWELRSYKSVGELITSIVRGIWLKLQLGRDVVPEHLSTHAEPVSSDIESDKLSIGAQPLSAIDPENLFTGAVPLNTNIVPEDIVTGSDPLKVKGNRTNEQAHAKATSKWSLIRSVFAVLYLLRRIRNREFCGFVSSLDGMHEVNDCVGGTSVEARSKHRFQRLALSSGTYSTSATSRWSLIRPVVTFLCFLFRLQRIRNRVYRRIFSLSGMHGVNDGVGGTSVEGLEDSQVLQIISLLDTQVNDVRIVGIHGRDGIGKTALAKIIYNKISLHFDACSFLAEIEETMQQPGGFQCLQTKLIFDILKREYEVASAFKGVRFLKEILRNVKVLLVLDDVENVSFLKEFVGAKLDWFGSGSRIIVTSKQRSILQGFLDQGSAHTYDVSSMDDNRAFALFWQYAMGKSYKHQPYVEIANRIVKAAEGLPLLVKVFGSFLHGKGQKEWIKFRDLIQQFQEDYQKILRTIYEALDQKQKQMYLDVACFLPDVDCRIASYMWHDYDRPHDEIEVLHRLSLIKMEENKIGMHKMLKSLARKIIYEGFHDPGTCVRFYIPAKAHDTKKRKRGTDHLNTIMAGFEILPSKTFLSLGCANIGGRFADALLNVRWLHWQGCPRDCEAISIHLENLLIVDLSWSMVTESWGGWKGIKMECLKVLNLTGCAGLLVTPSFSCYPNLEILILERCSRLVHLDPSINDLKLLVTLNLKFCSELSMLPVEMDGMNALEELLIDGTSVRELPASIGKLVQLQILSATNCFSLVQLPGSVSELKTLSVLALDNAKVLELPDSIGDLGELRRLSLRDCRGLGKLPESIGKLEDSLVELDISGTGISKLPDSTKHLQSLKVLKMDSCFLREFPSYIGELINLEEIHASWCRSLEGVIPSDIRKLDRLRELRLRCTRISSLPSEIQFMSSLQTLDLLHCNILEELPRLPSTLIDLYINPGLMQNM